MHVMPAAGAVVMGIGSSKRLQLTMQELRHVLLGFMYQLQLLINAYGNYESHHGSVATIYGSRFSQVTFLVALHGCQQP